jgi:hypothetical protein
MIDKEQFQLGLSLLAKVLKKVDIKVKGNVVELTQIFELPDETTAKAFAKTLASQYQSE